MKPCLIRNQLAAIVLGLFVSSAAHATLIGGQETGTCNPSPCDQTVGFSGHPTGITITGDTNPAPVYNVSVQSLEGLSLEGTGGVVDAGAGPTAGFHSILITPEAGWAWSVIEFTLDSVISSPTPALTGLTLTAIDQLNNSFTFTANFPWEGNNGDNQHYYVQGLNGEFITSLEIDYTDPNANEGNAIHDISNIDVASVQLPEPSTVALFGAGLLGLLGFGMQRGRRKA